jgi:hypothetical protein
MTLFDLPASAPDTHPAKWSHEVLAAVAPILAEWRLPVHDPFAGTGERLGKLCDQLELTFTGTEIQLPFIRDPRVARGDSTEADTYPSGDHVVVTSPAYPNGMADHFKAGDHSRRHTYRQALAEILGHDEPLHPNNMGRYGVRYGVNAETKHFDLARRCVRWWPEHVVLNVSDFIVAGAVYPCVARWKDILGARDYRIVETIAVETPRQRHGANGDARVGHEVVLTAVRQSERPDRKDER